MAKYSNTVEYNIRTTLDSSGITKLQAELSQLQNHLHRWNSRGLIDQSAFSKTIADIKTVQNALQQAFNPKLGMLNTSAFMKNLQTQGLTIKGLYESFSNAGAKGVQAFTSMYGQISKLDTGMRSVSSTTDKIMNTLGNTVRWGLIASGFSQVMNAAHQASQYVKDLDKSLTNIMMVSGETRDNMNAFAKSANEIAQRLGGTTTQMTEATKVFIQQGLSLEQSSRLAEYSVHLANVSEQDSATASDEITAYKNAFKIDLDDLGNAISKWAAVANNAAVSVEELSVASQKAASVATTVGVDMDQFAGHIAAIEATTREAPENIGNGLKTLYSRISDIKLGETLEDGVNLGQFTGALKKVGVEALDSAGELRDAGAIIEDIMAHWQEMSKTQQVATATTVAGRFQLARFMALMNSQDIYQNAVNVSRSETGTETYDRMQETYRESLEGRLNALTAKVEEIFLNLFNSDSFNGAVDALTGLVDVINELIKATGGGETAILGLSTALFGIAKQSMSRGITNFIQNREASIAGKQNLAIQQQEARNTLMAGGLNTDNERLNTLSRNVAGMNQFATELNGEQRERVNSLISQAIELENGLTAAKQAEADATTQLRAAIAAEGGEISRVGEELIQEIERLELDGQQIDINSAKYKEFMNLLNSTARSISEFNAKLKQNDAQFSKDEIMTYANHLKQLAQQEGVAAEQADVLMKAYGRLKNLPKVGADVQQVTKAIGQASVVMAEMSDALGAAPSKIQQVTNNYLNAKSAVAEFGSACQSTALQMKGLQETFQMQHVINNVSNMVMGIGQLAFAIQSIKNLGSIWNDEDLSYSEKMLETVMNLGMTLPMAVMGIQQLGQGYTELRAAISAYSAAKALEATSTAAAAVATEAAVKADGDQAKATAAVAILIEKLGNEEKKEAATKAYLVAYTEALNMGLSEEAAAAAGAAASIRVLNGVELQAAGSAGILSKALSFVKGNAVMLGVTAALAVAAIAWTNYQTAIENAKKAEMESLDTAIASAEETSKSVSSWKELYKEFEETGVASENARDKAKELAEELEIAGGKALAAAGDFDTLNDKILKLGDSAHQTAINEAWRLLQGEYGKSLSGEELFNGSAHGDYIGALNKGAGQVFSEGEGPFDTSSVAGIMRKHTTSGKSVAEDIMQAKAAIQELNEAEEELKKNQDNLSTEAFKRQSEDIRIARQALQEFLSLEDVQAAQKAYETLFSNGTQLSDFQEHLAEAGGDVQKMMEVFENDSNTGEYFSAITDRAERLKLMLAATKDEAQQLSIQLTQVADEAATNMMQNQLEAGASEGRARYVTQGIFDQVSDLNLYQEDAIKLIAQISETDSIQAINEGLARVKESGNIEDFKIPIEISPEEAKEAVRNAINSITEDSVDSDVDVEEVKSLANSFAEDAGSYEGYSEELEGNAEAAKEAAEELLRYDSALESVQKNSEEWEKQLTSGAVQDQVKAAEKLKNVYNDLLDVGEGLSVSNDFAQNVDNLKLLEDAANGVEGAYEKLQDAAEKDILVHFGVDDSEIPAILENVNSIQEQIEGLDIGVPISAEDEAFYQQLEAIVNAAGFNAEEASAYLSTIGVDIDPSAFEEGVQQVPQVAAEAAAEAADAMGIDTEIESGTAEEETTDTYSDVVANVTSVPIKSTLPAGEEGESKTLTGEAAQVTYNVQTHSIPKHQATAGFSVKAKTKNSGSGSGNLTIKRGAARKGGSGGTKYANASHGGGSQGGSSGSCFVAGTLITTYNGYKNIEDIKKYDIVLSYNEKLNKNEYSLVVDTMIHNVNERIYNLYIENEKLSVTGIHRFFVQRNGHIKWIEASELQINDLVWFADNTWHKINNITSEIQITTVYNFEVSGNHNYYVGQNQILAHNKGGGGGSGKSNEPKSVKRTDKADSEFDIYNKVNANLSKNEDLLTRIDKQKSRMSGSRYRDALSKENKALKDQNKILQERNKIANAKAEALRTGKDNAKYGIYLKGESLATYGLTDNDNNGTVDNYKNIYNQAYAKQLAAQKAADDYFKSKGGAFDAQGNTTTEASMTEDEQKTYTELAEKAKEAAEYANKIKSVVDDYQNTMDQIRDDTEKIQENTEKIEDNVITIWKYARDAGKELSKMKQTGVDVRKTLATMWGDDPVKSLGFSQEKFTKMFTPDTEGMAKSLKELKKLYNNTEDEEQKKWLNQQIKLLEKAQANGDSRLDLNLQKMNELNKAYDQWLKTGKSDLFGTNEKEMFDAMQEAFEEGASYADDMASAIEDIKQDIQDIMDEMYEGIDDRITQFDQIIEQYEYVRDMTELIYGDKAYEMQSKMYTSEAQAGEERLHTLEAARAENHAMLQSLQEGSEEYKKALEKERELDKEILSTRQDIVQAYKDAKEAANNLAVENWLSNFTTSMNYIDPDTKEIATAMGIPIKYAADQWERVKENADLYLDELNKAWEIEKLQNKYQKMLNEATDPKIQQQITQQMQQQLEYLRNKTKLSKYDVDYANAQLEILQKTMALEDARDAKNKMKLRRDSQGNYEYVYTADQNDIADKENELLDAQMNGYNISVEASRQATDNFFNQIQNMADKLREVANDSTLTAEQIEAITQDIIAQGYEFLNANAEQLTTAQINAVNSFIAAAQNLAAENAVQVNSISEQLLANTTDNADLMTSVLHSAVQEWIGPDGLALFREQADQTCEDIFDNVREFEKVISNANTNVKVPLNDMTATINGANTALTALAGTADKFYEFLRDRSGIVKTAAGDLADYQAALTDTNNKMSAYYDAWKKNEESLRTAQQANSQLEADLKSAQEDLAAERRKQEEEKKKREEEKKKKESSSNNNGGYSDEEIAWGIAKNIWTYGSWGNDPQRRQRITNRYGSSVASRVQQIINQYCWSGALVDYSSSKWGYATGGYTGSWNEVTDFDQNGKLAVLHQKELVLNANDTENMLAAVEVVRNIINMLKGANSPMNLSTLGLQNASANNIEQRVEITAEFPNVQSSNEIERALLNLADNAYMYAHNKNETFI